MKRACLLMALLGVSALGCGELPPSPGLVDQLRVLGVRAEPPEVSPGNNVSMEALIADPFGAGRELDVLWGVCIPDLAEGLASCTREAVIPLGTDPVLDYTVPANFLDILPEDQHETGLDLFVLVFVDAADRTESTKALKRVRISTSPEPNANPVLTGLDVIDDAPVKVEAVVDPATIEQYVDEDGETVPEDVEITFLVDGGEFDRYVTDVDEDGNAEAEWDPLDAASANAWLVVRDGRGGTAWAETAVP